MAEDVIGPIWQDDATILVLIGDRGRNLPYRVALDAVAEPLIDPEARVDGAGLEHDASSGRVAMSAGLEGSAEVYAIEGGSLRQVTREGSRWQRSFGRPEVAELELRGPAGPIHAWLASPARAGRRRLPLATVFHGG